MKPYKLIQSEKPLKKRTLVVCPLKPPKVPLVFFKKIHPLKKQNVKLVLEIS